MKQLFAWHFEDAWVLSRFTFSWLDKLVFKARFKKRKDNTSAVEDKDLSLDLSDRALVANKRFSKTWDQQKKRKSPSLMTAIIKTVLWDFVLAGIYKLCWSVLIVLCSFYFVRELVEFTSSDKADWVGWVLSVGFFIGCLLLSVTFQQMSSKSSQVGIRIRAALLTALFQKAMSLDMEELNAGDVVNLATNDCSRLMESCSSFHFLWSGTLESLAIVGLLIYLVGSPGWIALGIIIVLIVVQCLIGWLVAVLRSKSINTTDRRVSLMTEILMASKLVKLYAWEEFFAAKVKRIRRKEFFMMFGGSLIKTINLTIVFGVPPLIALSIFVVYIQKNGHLSPSVAFTTLSLFNTLRFPLVVLPKALRGFAEFIAAVSRLRQFLLKNDMQVQPREQNYHGIKMDNACFSYLNTDELLHNISFEIPKGKLCAIIGLVGSGKTNLILSVLGQMKLKAGTYAMGEGTVGYVPQVPWIQNGTIRDNILFGNSYDETRYKETVFACCLERDFEIMPDGDNTELSDRGANLSGGQKQRVALARAVYSNADMYFLDSPLSAVDQHTAIHIFEHCIRGMMKDKTVLLISHHLELLQECHLIAVMDSGRMTYFGEFNHEALHCVKRYFPHWAFEESKLDRKVEEFVPEELPVVELPDTPTIYASEEQLFLEADEERKDMEDGLKIKGSQEAPIVAPLEMDIEMELSDNSNEPVMGGDSQTDEKATSKKSKLRTLSFYGHYVWMRECGFLLVFISISIFALAQTTRIISDRWIGWWTDDRFIMSDGKYIWIYAVLVSGFVVLLIVRGVVFYAMTLRCSTHLHNRMFKSVLRAPMQFYNETPVGRILNCFSKDQDTADEALPDTIHMTIIYLMILLTSVIIVCVTIPLYTIILAVLVISFVIMYALYSNPASDLKERSGITNSSIFSHLNETLTGLVLIRAFGVQQRFESEYIQKIDDNHRSTFTSEQLQLWLSFRLDLVSSICVFVTAIFAVADKGSVNASSFGLAISNSFQQLVFFTWVVRGFAEINDQIACMERLDNYAYHVKPEAEARIRTTEPSGIWPPEGRVHIDSLFLRYSSHMPPVLKGVTLEIKPAEKVGVVGRTGSGKTTLLMSLFRLLEPDSGQITIDGVNISTLGLSDLRSRVAIIPQEPVLFMGTIRSNLDPFNKHTDDELWNALECANLKTVVQEMPLQLNNIVLENGSNYSLGQKQLFCLARAVLNQSKLLVFDEATAAMDLETDAMIQKTIRHVFASRTILTIAHRLDTIIDSDRIIVMEAGHVVEFDTPANLLSNQEGIFTKLVEQTGPDSAAALREIAFGHVQSH